jgi:hypothetical protein
LVEDDGSFGWVIGRCDDCLVDEESSDGDVREWLFKGGLVPGREGTF